MDSSFVWNINGVTIIEEGLSASHRKLRKLVYVLPSGRKLKVLTYEDIDEEYLIAENREE